MVMTDRGSASNGSSGSVAGQSARRGCRRPGRRSRPGPAPSRGRPAPGRPARRPRARAVRRGGGARRAWAEAYLAAGRHAPIARRERLRLLEPEADDAADRVVPDGHAVQRVGGLDRPPVVGDDDELRLVGEAPERVGEAPDVGLVERRVDLVEDAERDRPDLEHGEQQGDRRQGPLAARQHRERLGLLARWPGDDLDAGRAQVGRVGQRQLGEAAAEELLEAVREGALERGERRPEPIRDHRVELGDQVAGADDGGPQVGCLRLERLESRPERRVLIDGVRVDRAELVEAAPQLPEPDRARCRGRRWLGRPQRRHAGQRALERRDVVRDGVVVGGVGGRRDGRIGRRGGRSVTSSASVSRGRRVALARPILPGQLPQPGDPEISQAAQLDDHALVQRLEPEPGLEIDVVRAAQPGVGGTQALTCLGRLAFGRGAALAVDGVGGADLLERWPAPPPRWPSSRPSPSAACPSPRPATARARPARRPRDRRGPSAPRPARSTPRPGPALAPPRVEPPRERRHRRPVGRAGARSSAARDSQAASADPSAASPAVSSGTTGADASVPGRGHGRAGALELGSQSLGLRLVPGRLPDDRLQPSRREPFGLLGRPAFPTRPALLGAGGLDGGGGGLRAGGGPDGSRPQVRDLAVERRRLAGQAFALGAPFEDRLGGTERDPEVADHRGPVARHGDPAGRQHRPGWPGTRQDPAARPPGPGRAGPPRRRRDGPRHRACHHRPRPGPRGTGARVDRQRRVGRRPAPRRRARRARPRGRAPHRRRRRRRGSPPPAPLRPQPADPGSIARSSSSRRPPTRRAARAIPRVSSSASLASRPSSRARTAVADALAVTARSWAVTRAASVASARSRAASRRALAARSASMAVVSLARAAARSRLETALAPRTTRSPGRPRHRRAARSRPAAAGRSRPRPGVPPRPAGGRPAPRPVPGARCATSRARRGRGPARGRPRRASPRGRDRAAGPVPPARDVRRPARPRPRPVPRAAAADRVPAPRAPR